MRDRLINDLDSADLFLRNRATSSPAPLNEYDIEEMLDIAKICDEAARTLEKAIVPPCKVGDTVYEVIVTTNTRKPVVRDVTISQISVETGALLNSCYAIGRIGKSKAGMSFDFDDIGKTVFLTRAEAEQKLKEREG